MKDWHKHPSRHHWRWLLILLAAVLTAACQTESRDWSNSPVTYIADEDALQAFVRRSGPRLVLLEFYADWCSPCKELAPVLDAIAAGEDERVAVGAMDYEKNKTAAARFQVRGIPFVIFIRRGQIVDSLMGLHPKSSYLELIDRYAVASG
jgi:thioredoxin 1